MTGSGDLQRTEKVIGFVMLPSPSCLPSLPPTLLPSFPSPPLPTLIFRIRLRKKTWRTAGTVYVDSQIFDKDIHVFANFEMYVEPLEGM